MAAAADHEWIANATGNLTQVEDLDCPQSSETSERIVAEFSFWVEGVTQVTKVFYLHGSVFLAASCYTIMQLLCLYCRLSWQSLGSVAILWLVLFYHAVKCEMRLTSCLSL